MRGSIVLPLKHIGRIGLQFGDEIAICGKRIKWGGQLASADGNDIIVVYCNGDVVGQIRGVGGLDLKSRKEDVDG